MRARLGARWKTVNRARPAAGDGAADRVTQRDGSRDSLTARPPAHHAVAAAQDLPQSTPISPRWRREAPFVEPDRVTIGAAPRGAR